MKRFLCLLLTIILLLSSVTVVGAVAAQRVEMLDLSGTQTLYTQENGNWETGSILARNESGTVLTDSLTYRSDCPQVLTIATDGMVTPLHEGFSVVTVTYTNPDRTTVSANIVITVAKTVRVNNSFESGNNLKLNFSRGGQHSLYPYVAGMDVKSSINVQSWTNSETYKRFAVEAWFYDDGVIAEGTEAGGMINFNAWNYGNVTIGILDKSSPYYSYTNVKGARTASQLTPALRNEITYLNGHAAHDEWPYDGREAHSKRSKGWHQVMVCANTNTENQNLVRFYIDGVEVMTENFTSVVQDVTFSATENAFYDDLRLVTFSGEDFSQPPNSVTAVSVYGDLEVEGTVTARADRNNPFEFFKCAVVAEKEVKSGVYYEADGTKSTASYHVPSYAWTGEASYTWQSSESAVDWTDQAPGNQYTFTAEDEGRYFRVKAEIPGGGVGYSNIFIVGTAISYEIKEDTVRFIGRSEEVPGKGRSINFPQAGYEFSFTGTMAELRISSASADDTYLNVSVDGGEAMRLPVSGPGWITLVQNLKNATHTVRVTRSNEAGAFLYTDKIKTDGGAPTPTEARVRRMEFIGDSYTVGYGNLDHDGTHTSEVPAYTDSWQSYASIAARAFDADANLIASSGKGLYANLIGFTSQKTMVWNYDYADYWQDDTTTKWDFSSYTPQVVVIFLGTNDYAGTSGSMGSEFYWAYCDFIAKIRDHYPNAHIICCSKSENCYGGEAERAVENAGGAANRVYYLQFADFGASAIHGHPNVTEHDAIARQLVDKINQIEDVWLTGESVSVTLSIGTGGQVLLDQTPLADGGMLQIPVGGSKRLTLLPEEGYEVGQVSLDGQELPVQNNQVEVGGLAVSGKLLSVQFEKEENGELAFYVANDGNDNNPGTLSQPFRTITRARNEIRALDELPSGGVTVYFRGGIYRIASTFELTAQDSGTAESPVTYRNYKDEKVSFSGGTHFDLTSFKPVEGEMRSLLRSEEAKSRVLVADLDDLGVGQMGEYAIRDNQSVLAAPVITWDGDDMPLASYPNSTVSTSWVDTVCTETDGTNRGNGKVSEDTRAFTIKYDDEVPDTWSYGLDHIMLKGFFYHYWYAPIRYVTIDREKHFLTARENSDTAYGIAKNTPMPTKFMNVYQEIDIPGEWYIDFDTQKLYLWPLTNNQTPEISITTADCTLMTINKAEYVNFRGITFTQTKNSGITVNSAKNILFDKCTISAAGRYGMTWEDVWNCTFRNGEVKYTGVGGIHINSGGNKETLAYGNNLITNSLFDNCSYAKETYAPGVVLDGVGNTASHNEFKNFSHSALVYGGVLNTVEYNEFYDCCINGADAGVIYSGRDLGDHGTVIRYNHFYNIGNEEEGRQFYPCCVFTDDGSSDMELYGNVFGPNIAECEAFKVHGGQNNNAYHNLFIDAPRAHHMADWSDSDWQYVITENYGSSSWISAESKESYFAPLRAILANPLYQEKWPWLKEAYETPEKACYKGNYFNNNILIYLDKKPGYGGNPWWIRGQDGHTVLGADTNVILKNGDKKMFADYDGGNYNLSGETYEKYSWFPYIDFESIGRYEAVNQPPSVKDITISGMVTEGQTLRVSYRYTDPEADLEGSTQVRWLVADSINGLYTEIKTGRSLTLNASFKGKYFRACITPADETGLVGETACSNILYGAWGDASLSDMITALQAAADAAVAGTQLGCYPAQSIADLRDAVAQAGAMEPAQALAFLSTAFGMFEASQVTEVMVNGGTVIVPGNIRYAVINTGEVTSLSLHAPDGKIPETVIRGTINSKELEIVIPACTVSDTALIIRKEDTPDLNVYGRVLHALELGGLAMTVRIDGSGGKTLVTNEGETPIARTDAFNTVMGGEYIIAELYVKSPDTSLSSITVDGKSLKLTAGKTSYSTKVKKDTAGFVEAKPVNEFAVAEVIQAPAIPGTATITLIAQDGTTAVYTVEIGVSDEGNVPVPYPTTCPTVYPSTVGGGAGSPVGSSLLNPAAPEIPQPGFTDIEGHWAQTEILDMARRGIVFGVTTTSFEPERSITRAEFATLAVKTLNLVSSASAGFSDVTTDAWYYPYINAATNAGLIAGYDGLFHPDDLITREEMAVVIAKAYAYQDEIVTGTTGQGIEQFADQDQISAWAAPYVDTVTVAGLLSGMGNGLFAPQQNATRAQAVSLLSRLLAVL